MGTLVRGGDVVSRKKRIYRTYRFHCFAELKDGVYIGYCLEAGTVSSGLTVDEVRKNVGEAIEALMVYACRTKNYKLLRRGSSLRVWLKYMKVRLLIPVLRLYYWMKRLFGSARQFSLGYVEFPVEQEAVC